MRNPRSQLAALNRALTSTLLVRASLDAEVTRPHASGVGSRHWRHPASCIRLRVGRQARLGTPRYQDRESLRHVSRRVDRHGASGAGAQRAPLAKSHSARGAPTSAIQDAATLCCQDSRFAGGQIRCRQVTGHLPQRWSQWPRWPRPELSRHPTPTITRVRFARRMQQFVSCDSLKNSMKLRNAGTPFGRLSLARP